MSNKILILYASVDGQTKKIAAAVHTHLHENGHQASLQDIDEFDNELNQFELVIVGSSIRYGVHHKSIIDFINEQQATLDKKKTAFFSVNLVARKPEKNKANTNPYVIKFLKEISWRPQYVEVFAGKLDYQKYPFFDRIMIQFIMWMTKGPTDSKAKIEYTDWNRVEEFSQKVLTL